MKRLATVVVCSALALSLAGCGTYDHTRNGQRTNNNNNLTPQAARDGQQIINDRAVRNDTMMNDRSMNKEQKRLMQHVRNVDGVNDATVVVNGKDIIVGLDVNNVSQRAEVEKQVRTALMKENAGYTVHVTSERAMHDRIRSLKGQMEPLDGHPIRNMANDIGVLLEDMGRAVTEPMK